MKRNCWNFFNTCTDALSYAIPDKPDITPEEAQKAISVYIDRHLDGTEFGSFLLNVNYSTSMIPSNTMDTVWKRINGEEISREALEASGHTKNGRYITLHNRGIEPFSIAMDCIRKHGAEVWLSVRMNDYHDLAFPLAVRSFWADHPEYRLGPKKTFNFKYKEVRDEMKRYISELCSTYDIDGIELDLLRGSSYFEAPVTPENITIMREYLSEIRQEINEIGSKKGKKIRCIARVYSDLYSNLFCGLDTIGFIKDKSVDALVLSNYFSPSDFTMNLQPYIERLEAEGVNRESYKLIAGADFAVSCGGSMIAPRSKFATITQDTNTLKGFAANAFFKGADGIYLFNTFMMRPEADFKNIGSLQASVKGVRNHIATVRDPGEYPLFPQVMMPARYDYLSVLNYTIPTSVAPESGSYRVIVGTDFPTAPTLLVNGTPAKNITETPSVAKKQYIDRNEVAPFIHIFDVPLSEVNNGDNTISICHSDETSAETLLWLEVEIVANA